MDVIDFVRETAIFMAKDRPDVYDNAVASRELASAMQALRESDKTYACVMFTSYMLARTLDDGVEEFLLTRKISSVIVCEEEEECIAFSHVPEVNLPDVNEPLEALDDDEDL